MPVSRLTSKGQVTLPKEVRRALNLAQGDLIAYEIRDDVAVLKKIEPFDRAYHEAIAETLEEWNSAEDEDAFRNL